MNIIALRSRHLQVQTHNGAASALRNCSSISSADSYDMNGTVVNCSAEVYVGSVCRRQLTAWQESTLGQAEKVYVELTPEQYTQAERERDAAQFLYFLRELSNLL